MCDMFSAYQISDRHYRSYALKFISFHVEVRLLLRQEISELFTTISEVVSKFYLFHFVFSTKVFMVEEWYCKWCRTWIEYCRIDKGCDCHTFHPLNNTPKHEQHQRVLICLGRCMTSTAYRWGHGCLNGLLLRLVSQIVIRLYTKV